MGAAVEQTDKRQDSRDALPGIRMLIGGNWRNGAMEYDIVDPYRREGPRYAIRDMTEDRLVMFNL